ncbi:MAG: hypothetical protein K6F76_00665 [Clostridiales bacterium]|nr:hypothetical protein [Clostridiales bacterium]
MSEKYINTLSRDTHILVASLLTFDMERQNSNVLANVRREYFKNGFVPKSKVTESWGGISCKYLYGLSKSFPLKWQKFEGETLIEFVELANDYYCVETISPVDFFTQKKQYFSREHEWIKTEYLVWNQVSPARVLKAHRTSMNINLISEEKGVETILYPCLMPQNDREMNRMKEVAEVPDVACHTTKGYYYYAPYDKAVLWGQTLERVREELRGDIDVYDENVDREAGFDIDIDSVSANGDYKIDITRAASEMNTSFDEEYDSVDLAKLNRKSKTPYFYNDADPRPRMVNMQNDIPTAYEDVPADIDGVFNDMYDNDEGYYPQEEPANYDMPQDYSYTEEQQPYNEPYSGSDVPQDDYNAFDYGDVNPEPENYADNSYIPEEEPAKAPVDDALQQGDSTNIDYNNERLDEVAVQPDRVVSDASGGSYYYTGELKDGLRDGYGRTAMEKGNTAYEGEYKNDKRDGVGAYYYKSGKLCHVGQWKKNKRSGFGMALNSSQDVITVGKWINNKQEGIQANINREGDFEFIGAVSEGVKNGLGMRFDGDRLIVESYENGIPKKSCCIFDADGKLLYNGEIKDNKRNGYGVSYNENGMPEYSGAWTDDVYNGLGRLVYDDGRATEGYFENGKPHGKCRLYSSNGYMIYDGEIENGEYNGKGKLYKNGKLIYDGGFKNGLKNGEGNEYSNGRLVYSGSFFDDVRKGFGTAEDGDKIYTGMWDNNTYNGCGMLFSGEAQGYVGSFLNGKPAGRVNIISNGVVVSRCLFRDNECVFIKRYTDDGKTLIYEGAIRDGVPHGMGREFDNDGNKIFEGIYKKGVKQRSANIVMKELEPLDRCDELADTDYNKYL